MPKTLFGYIARQFLTWCGGVFFVMLAIIFMSDLIELIRRSAARPEATMLVLIEMTSLKLPYTAQEAMPFAILIGSILTFWRMTRTQELVVARAAGVSVWQFLMPGLSIAFVVGAIGVTIFNPVASLTQSSYKALENRVLRGGASSLLLSDSGLWLRQSDGTGTQSVIHAVHFYQPETRVTEVTIFFFRQSDRLSRRIDAQSAQLETDRWRVNDAWEWQEGRAEPVFSHELYVPTNLTPKKIEESFASPETMSFWQLPSFIALLESSGFSAQSHRLYFDKLLARPFLLCAMVLIAALFSLRMQRRGGTTMMIVGGVLAGFVLYFVSDVVGALGQSATIPVALAAWTPTGISMLLGTTLLLHLEDG